MVLDPNDHLMFLIIDSFFSHFWLLQKIFSIFMFFLMVPDTLYLILTELPKHGDEKGNIDTAELDYLMPWSESLPEECRKPRRS